MAQAMECKCNSFLKTELIHKKHFFSDTEVITTKDIKIQQEP